MLAIFSASPSFVVPAVAPARSAVRSAPQMIAMPGDFSQKFVVPWASPREVRGRC